MKFLGIDWKSRFSNPIFWVQCIVSLFVPILTYFGRDFTSITSWPALFDLIGQALSNPVVVVSMLVSLYNAVIDPRTKGLCDKEE